MDMQVFSGSRSDADFNEADHPRDEDGKFTSGGGYAASHGVPIGRFEHNGGDATVRKAKVAFVSEINKALAAKGSTKSIKPEDIKGGASKGGTSLYIDVPFRWVGSDGKVKTFENYRLSDHSTGERRYGEHNHIQSSEDLDEALGTILTKIKNEKEWTQPPRRMGDLQANKIREELKADPSKLPEIKRYFEENNFDQTFLKRFEPKDEDGKFSSSGGGVYEHLRDADDKGGRSAVIGAAKEILAKNPALYDQVVSEVSDLGHPTSELVQHAQKPSGTEKNNANQNTNSLGSSVNELFHKYAFLKEPQVKAIEEVINSAKGQKFKVFGIRIVPSEYEGGTENGSKLKNSFHWINGDITSKELEGTSTIGLADLSPETVAKALNTANLLGNPKNYGYYSGSKVVLVGGDKKKKGEDDGEWIISNATVVNSWGKKDGRHPILPNEEVKADSFDARLLTESYVRSQAPVVGAGILFVTPDRKALFVKRGNTCDHPGEWCLPGGKVENGETVEACAERETVEEIGSLPKGDRATLIRSIVAGEAVGAVSTSVEGLSPGLPSADVDFTTFVQRVKEPFDVTLSDEHTGHAWASVDAPPEPLHPGVRIALDRLCGDELAVARMMAAGALCGPQRYHNMTLFAIRITGTGVAYRSAHKEYVWRDPALYLNPDFVARCNGLTVIWEHPTKDTLNSKEFAKRVIGSVFLPFIPALSFIRANPKARDTDVWAIAKIYDDEAIEEMSDTDTDISTSPSVVFTDPAVNSTMTLDDGSPLLIEGKPSLLDHVAICAAGVWDKGEKPSGVINDSFGDNSMTEEEIKAAAEKDKAQARADAQPKTDGSNPGALDAILAAITGLGSTVANLVTRMDSVDEKMADAKKDSDTDPADKDKAKDIVADKKADGEDCAKADEDEEKAKADAAKKADEDEAAMADKAKADAAERDQLKARLADIEKRLPMQLSDKDYASMADAQAKADGVFQAFGDSAPRPLQGEDLLAYRKRIAGSLKVHSNAFKGANLALILDEPSFNAIEAQIYSDAVAAALNPVDMPTDNPARTRRDQTGRNITEFGGSPRTWMQGFMPSPRRGKLQRPDAIRA